jgi:tRNA (cmo5U34)-methyltransferase
MKTSLAHKSSLEEIRQRFDEDVERFSNLETGQSATVDAPLALELVTQAAIAATPLIRRVLDIGCGAGNFTLRLARSYASRFDADLCDLSLPMLQQANRRLSEEKTGVVRLFHGDFARLDFPPGSYDVILAAAVLHHLREKEAWESAFRKIYDLLRPGGSFWVFDLVSHEIPAVQNLLWSRYGGYLETMGGPDYRDQVFQYIEREDSPRPLTYQLDLLRRSGFDRMDVLHKNSCFAAFGGIKQAASEK